MRRRGFRYLLQNCCLVGKVAAERADMPRRTGVFPSAFGLGFIGEDHFANGITTGDGGIKD